jgi:hypothetical protein
MRVGSDGVVVAAIDGLVVERDPGTDVSGAGTDEDFADEATLEVDVGLVEPVDAVRDDPPQPTSNSSPITVNETLRSIEPDPTTPAGTAIIRRLARTRLIRCAGSAAYS